MLLFLGQEQLQSKNISKKAHLDTLRRREKRQRSQAALLENSEELGRLNDNRIILVSETDDEEITDNDLSETDNKTQVMRNNNNGASKNNNNNRQAKRTTEVPMSSEHVVSNKTKVRGNNQRQVHGI